MAALVGLSAPLAANAALPYPSDSTPPDLTALLRGYDDLWQPESGNDLHGTVLDPATTELNDELTVWINQHATADQQFTALQDSEYEDFPANTYDQSITASTALGSVLGPLYVAGRQNGVLPLTSALINSSDGTSGAYVSTGASKETYNYPRPYLPTDPSTPPVPGDAAACDPAPTATPPFPGVNGSSLTSERVGTPYAGATGNLDITRVPAMNDATHEFSPNIVPLDAGYGTSDVCLSAAFPSGHTTTAYQAGITLATLLPEFAPEILARASEAGNNRIVLGVHYPLDIVGGRMSGEAALAARWSDAKYRTEVLEPARIELVNYLQEQCGTTIAVCASAGTPYQNDPYGGAAIPGGTAQIVTDRASAAAVYRERLTYGIPQTGMPGQAPSVPPGAENLLLTLFPTLTATQRTSVLAQTQIDSGYPLDLTGAAGGSWQRLDLAAATSATVQVNSDDSVTIVSTGGQAAVLPAPTAPPAATTAADPSLAASGLDVTPLIVFAVGVLGAGTWVRVSQRHREPLARSSGSQSP